MREASSESRRRFTREVVIAVASGLAASAATGLVDRALDPLVSTEQKLREKLVRSGSPHEVVGPMVMGKILGYRPSASQRSAAQFAFGITYGVFWGLVYAVVRRSFPAASRAAGLPFAVPFYFACDGIIAPLVGLGPTITRVPWQLNVKELANHFGWTATAELAHRSARWLGV
jgi:putative membrane protein